MAAKRDIGEKKKPKVVSGSTEASAREVGLQVS